MYGIIIVAQGGLPMSGSQDKLTPLFGKKIRNCI